ncbi:hypothetical protein [Stutzerimonas chloritidismutans]|uniref:hypothetical protein n=1 Tax=Stutzerimonas chloritidismutans TaxID=203192 RepID=UPI003F147CA7
MIKPLRSALPVLLAALVGGCVAVEHVPPPKGDDEYVFACAQEAGQPSCDARAEAACPAGYETLRSEQGFERKELRVRCRTGGSEN